MQTLLDLDLETKFQLKLNKIDNTYPKQKEAALASFSVAAVAVHLAVELSLIMLAPDISEY